MRRPVALLLFGLCADAAQIVPKPIPLKFRVFTTPPPTTTPEPPTVTLKGRARRQVQRESALPEATVLTPPNALGRFFRKLLAPARVRVANKPETTCCTKSDQDCWASAFPSGRAKEPLPGAHPPEHPEGNGLGTEKVERETFSHTEQHNFTKGKNTFKFYKTGLAFKQIMVVPGVPIMTSEFTWAAARVTAIAFAAIQMKAPLPNPPHVIMAEETTNWRKTFATDEGFFLPGSKPMCDDHASEALAMFAKPLESGMSTRAICKIIDVLRHRNGIVVMSVGPKGQGCEAKDKPTADSYVTLFGVGIKGDSWLQNDQELLDQCHAWIPSSDLWQQVTFFANDPAVSLPASQGDCITTSNSMYLAKGHPTSECARLDIDSACGVSLVEFTNEYNANCNYALEFKGFSPDKKKPVQASRMWLVQAPAPFGPGPSFAAAASTMQRLIGNRTHLAHLLPV